MSIFSQQENLLASQLELLYQEYQERQKLDLPKFYTEKLHALEKYFEYLKQHPVLPNTARDTALKVTLKARPSSAKAEREIRKQSAEHSMKLKEQREKIRNTRILRDTEELTDINITKKMMSVWRQLQEVRMVF